MAAARIAIKYGIRGYSSSIGTACAAGAQSIAEALRLIRGGEADVVVCGGSEAPLLPDLRRTFGNARALARGWADPAAASRPFDRRRNGFVLAEGAACSCSSGPRRPTPAARPATPTCAAGAPPPTRTTRPRPGRTAPAPRTACAAPSPTRGLAPSDMDYVNAHGTGTKLGDVAETVAHRTRSSAGTRPPVSSIKGADRALLGGSGAVEAVATALSRRPRRAAADAPTSTIPTRPLRPRPRPRDSRAPDRSGPR